MTRQSPSGHDRAITASAARFRSNSGPTTCDRAEAGSTSLLTKGEPRPDRPHGARRRTASCRLSIEPVYDGDAEVLLGDPVVCYSQGRSPAETLFVRARPRSAVPPWFRVPCLGRRRAAPSPPGAARRLSVPGPAGCPDTVNVVVCVRKETPP